MNAPIVLDVFTRYSEGETIRSILDDINSKMSNNGRKFTYHFLNWMLNNRRYLGEYKFQDTINNEAIPPIVSQELFDKCQHRLNVNKHKAGSFKNNKEKYLLTGKSSAEIVALQFPESAGQESASQSIGTTSE